MASIGRQRMCAGTKIIWKSIPSRWTSFSCPAHLPYVFILMCVTYRIHKLQMWYKRWVVECVIQALWQRWWSRTAADTPRTYFLLGRSHWQQAVSVVTAAAVDFSRVNPVWAKSIHTHCGNSWSRTFYSLDVLPESLVLFYYSNTR